MLPIPPMLLKIKWRHNKEMPMMAMEAMRHEWLCIVYD
jgi:hypothetical protein